MKVRIAAVTVLLALISCPAVLCAKNEEQEKIDEAVRRRQEVELKSFFLSDPDKAILPGAPLSITFFNEAVQYFQKNDYAMARQALNESLRHDRQNAFAYELLADIDSLEHRLPQAKANYEIAYNMQPTAALKTKLEKLQQETAVDKTMQTSHEEHFLIKYHDREGSQVQGFELRELLHKTYRQISQDFAFYFKHQVAVLLYDEDEFKKLTNLPHWVTGVYDGKVRMPLQSHGFDALELRALTTHEVTHAFVAAMSAYSAPAWLNEGIAQYEESKVRPIDMLVFNAAVKTNTLMPIEALMLENPETILTDALKANLFYRQTYHLTRYLVERYGMYRIKEMLAAMGKGQNSEEAIRGVLKISVPKLEREWRATITPSN